MIRNIIFDFGNVLLNLDENATWNRLTDILDSKLCHDIQEQVYDPYERGEISEEAFFNRLQRRSKVVMQGDVYYDAWNAMLGSLPQNRINALIELKKKYKIILLSNTNITHIRYVSKKIKRENNILDFEKDLFDHVYFSHIIKMRKPESRIYQYVIDDAKIIPHETIFIDDKKENTDAALPLGIKSYCHNPSQDIMDIIESIIAAHNG